MSIVLSSIVIGYDVIVSFSTDVIYDCTPLDSDMISPMPMMPMLPANAVKNVLPFFVIKLLSESDKAVQNDIEGFLSASLPASSKFSFSSTGFESLTICPSLSSTIRVEYTCASSGLCVTITTRRSLAIS